MYEYRIFRGKDNKWYAQARRVGPSWWPFRRWKTLGCHVHYSYSDEYYAYKFTEHDSKGEAKDTCKNHKIIVKMEDREYLGTLDNDSNQKREPLSAFSVLKEEFWNEVRN